MKARVFFSLLLFAIFAFAHPAQSQTQPAAAGNPDVYPMQEGFVDAHGELIYYMVVGRGAPLVLLHGGPGATHDIFLPYLLPLARHNQLVFIDERGSGESQQLSDPKGYTIENMVEDVEDVRQALHLGKISLLGHSYGGALAQAYALKYQKNLTHLILSSTFSSTKDVNKALADIKKNMPPALRRKIDKMEKEGLFGKGLPYHRSRYPDAYMVAAWGEGYFPYLYHNRPDPNFDPIAQGVVPWDLYREMWGSHGEFVIDGNMKSIEYTSKLHLIHVPTLILVGDHDESAPWISKEMHEKIAGSKLVIFPKSGHLTFVDQNDLYIHAVDSFLNPGGNR